MLSAKPLSFGDLRIKRYDFERKGELVPKHVHSERDAHITIVALGRIRAYSHDWSVEAKAGDTIDFRAGEPHEIVALEDGTRIFNIVKSLGGTLDGEGEG